jgi:flavorubredoxin
MSVAAETLVLQHTWGEGTAPQVVHMNAMVIRDAGPIVVDTGCPFHRDHYFDDLFNLIEPSDVRWVFISHDDIDHYGKLGEAIHVCPRATLVAHGPTITAADLPTAFGLLRNTPTTPSSAAQPGQPVLDQVIADIAEREA